jgi:hypothetical protein
VKFVPALARWWSQGYASWGIAVSVSFALCVAALLALWASHSLDTEVSTVVPTQTAETRIIFMGLRDGTTDPFFLGGGNYRGIWSAWGETPVDPPCTHSVELVAVDSANASRSMDLAKLVQVPSTGATAEINLININPGDYYLEISSACGWQIELSVYN